MSAPVAEAISGPAPDRREGLRYGVAGAIGAYTMKGVLATARFETEGAEHWRALVDRGEAFIFVLWHGRLLPLTYVHREQGVVALISASRDGEYIARMVRHWGYLVARGSSSRGGDRALRDLLRHARAGRSLAITPDGPRGPRERIKPGVMLLAQRTGLPLLPIAAGADRAWWFEGWDRFLVPKPFARIRVAYGAPHYVARDADEAAVEAARARLEAAMADVMTRADDRDD